MARLPKVSVTVTVRYDWPTTTGVISGWLDSDNSRLLATTEDDDLVALMCDGDPLGARIVVKSFEHGNRACLA